MSVVCISGLAIYVGGIHVQVALASVLGSFVCRWYT